MSGSQADPDGVDLSDADDQFADRGGHRVQPDENVDYTLSSNVARDLVKYVRSNTIRNEQQFLLVTLGYLTGYFDEADHYVSGVIIGTSSSGKTHVQGKIEDLFPADHLYQATTGSEKSLIYDGEWDEAYTASLDELQKPSQSLIEFLKGVHGDDDQFTYKLTPDSAEEREDENVKTITRLSKPYWFLYAQYEPDFEMWNRLLKVPIHESRSKNKAVGAMAHDHHHISIGNEDVEYGYDFREGTRALQAHVASIADEIESGNVPGYVHLPNGGEDFDWNVWEIDQDIFNHDRTEVNRIYDMVANLIRASALLNHHNRDVRTVFIPNEGTRDAIIAEPQDLANVLDCREALLATTHEIDKKKRAICNAIEEKSGADNEVEGMGPIREGLKESDAPVVKESEMEHILNDLQDNYLIDIHPNAGDSRKDIYEFFGWDELGFANVQENPDLFESVFSPSTGEPFVDAHEKLRDRLETDAQDLLKSAGSEEVTSSSSSVGGNGQDLASFGGGSTVYDVDLEPHERVVHNECFKTLDNRQVKDLTDVPVEAMIGLTPPHDPNLADVDAEGTILDPTHEVWFQPGRPDDWIETEQDAKREVKRAIRELISNQLIQFDEVHKVENGDPVDATLAVVPPDDV